MFEITEFKEIKLTKGDNAEIDIRVNNKLGVEVEILPSDVITLAVRKSPNQEVLIRKEAELNSIYLVPEDTANLDPGLYVYDIDFVRDGEKQTIVPMNFFEILEEI